MTVAEPSITKVMLPRWRCVWCHRSWSKRTTAVQHVETCAQNPAARSCSTCRHFRRTPCCPVGSDSCGCRGLNECTVGGFEKWRYNNPATMTPVADGWWTHVVDWRRDCPLWEPNAIEPGGDR